MKIADLPVDHQVKVTRAKILADAEGARGFATVASGSSRRDASGPTACGTRDDAAHRAVPGTSVGESYGLQKFEARGLHATLSRDGKGTDLITCFSIGSWVSITTDRKGMFCLTSPKASIE